MPIINSRSTMAPRKRSADDTDDRDNVANKARPTMEGDSKLEVNLPVDIIRMILEHLAPPTFRLKKLGGGQVFSDFDEHIACRKDLVSLSKTCRTLRSLAIPVLYRHVFINNMRCLADFFNNLFRFPKRGSFVRQLNFTLPDPASQEPDHYFLDNDLVRELTDPRYRNSSSGRSNADLLSLLHSRYHSEQAGEFMCGNVGSLMLPIMAITRNLENLNIAGYHQWTRWPYSHASHQDPFMKFVSGTDIPASEGHSSGTFRFYFPKACFGVGRWDPTDEMAPVFPPPLLKRIDILSDAITSPTNLVTSRLRIVEPLGCQKLLSLTENLEKDLEVTGDIGGDLIPSSALQMIADQDVTRDVLASNYLERIFRFDKSLRTPETDYAGTQVPSMASLSHSLDHAFNKTKAMAVPIVLHSQEVTMDLLTFLALGDQGRFHDRAVSLTLHYNTSRRELPSSLRSPEGKSLSRCIGDRFNCLQLLNMTLFVHKDSRNMVYKPFIPAEFTSIRELSLTIEGLWGPVRPVIKMLEMATPFEQWGFEESQDPEPVLDTDGTPIFDSDGQPITRPTTWEKKRIAVKRIPPDCESLCIRDWFAEYTRPRPTLDQNLHQLQTIGQVEEAGEFEIAVLNDTLYNYPAIAHLVRFIVDDNQEVPFSQVVAVMLANPRYDRCVYPNTWWDKVFDPEPLYKSSKVPEFTDRYIAALTTGLRAMCVYRRPAPVPVGVQTRERDPSLMTELRPTLKKIVFVYTLQSELPGGRDRIDNHHADLKWRLWYHLGLEAPGQGFQELKREVLEASGISLELYEGEVGVIPKEPVWPKRIRAKAIRNGVTLDDSNHLWEERATERARSEGVRRSLRLRRFGNH